MISRFGLSLPVVQQVPARAAEWERGAGGGELAAIARAADRLGYRYVTCSDHVVVAASHAAAMGATWYEPSATLGFIAAVAAGKRMHADAARSPGTDGASDETLGATFDATCDATFDGTFESIAPLRVLAARSGDPLRAKIDRWAASGAFHVGLDAASAAEFVERLEWFRELAGGA